MGVKWISSWSQELTVGDEEGKLAKVDGKEYFAFDGSSVTLEEDAKVTEGGKNVNIGIYQVTDDVYAFASTATENSTETVKKIGDKDAKLIATGTADITEEEASKKISNIAITLKGDESGKTFQKLGFSGENISKIADSNKADTIYVIGDGESKGLPNADLAFTQGTANDKVIFVGSSTIKSITSGGGGYTRLRVRGHPSFQSKS